MEKLVKDEEEKEKTLSPKKKKKRQDEKKKFSDRINEKRKKIDPNKTKTTSDDSKAERLKLSKIDDPTKEKGDEDEKKPIKQKEENKEEGNVDYFGTKSLENTRLKSDGIKAGESNKEKGARFSKMMKRSNAQLFSIRNQEKESLRRIDRECDSEDKLDKSLDYQRLISAISQQQICRQIHKDISYHVGNSYMEKAYKVAENQRKVEREMANLHHVEFTIKRRYMEVSPDSGVTFKDKLKSKTFMNTTFQFREHTGGYVDQET